ncbi:MAG: hypothetical protein IIA67_10320 [Planctomycetes bacterium]|nr:hypothetical protein [Planctomycetota bacterium]
MTLPEHDIVVAVTTKSDPDQAEGHSEHQGRAGDVRHREEHIYTCARMSKQRPQHNLGKHRQCGNNRPFCEPVSLIGKFSSI